MRVIVLGSGLVGAPMARDLALDFDVSVADINEKSFERFRGTNIQTIRKDLSDPGEVKNLVKDFDCVISAVPGFLGFTTLKAVIESGKNVVDIAFFPEDALKLDRLAKEKGVTAVADCGVAPGMSNLLFGYVYHLLDETHSALCYVGGLPVVREWPFEYKAVFSPIDVIEEYVRPSRFVENGRIVEREALSDPELLDFQGIGTLEAFNTDGLRSLIKTLKIPNMKEKTLRYPGHIGLMRILRETGFFSTEEIEIDGKRIRPLDLTTRLLFPRWKLGSTEADITVMKVIIEGRKKKKNLRYIYELIDRYDPQTGVHSMARTTGYTATAVLRMIAKGQYKRKGISVPEYLGEKKECVDFVMSELKRRGVIWKEKIEEF